MIMNNTQQTLHVTQRYNICTSIVPCYKHRVFYWQDTQFGINASVLVPHGTPTTVSLFYFTMSLNDLDGSHKHLRAHVHSTRRKIVLMKSELYFKLV